MSIEYKTLIEAKKILKCESDSQLIDKIEKNKLPVVFRYFGAVASNDTIESIASNNMDDPNLLTKFMNGQTSMKHCEEPKGHYSFFCSGWFECNSLKVISDSNYFQLTAKLFENVRSDKSLNEGAVVAFFDTLTSPDEEHGRIPNEENHKGYGININQSMLHIPAHLLSNVKGSAIDCKTIKLDSKKGQGDSLLILGAVMSTIKSVAKPNYTDTLLIQEIVNKYSNISGISKSTLEKKFSDAKKHFKTKL